MYLLRSGLSDSLEISEVGGRVALLHASGSSENIKDQFNTSFGTTLWHQIIRLT